jgi:hypothetical protein
MAGSRVTFHSTSPSVAIDPDVGNESVMPAIT